MIKNKKLQIDIDKENGWKICYACSTKKDLSEFHINKKQYVYKTICKDCGVKRTKVWRSKNREKINKEQRIYKKQRRENLEYVRCLESESSKRTYKKYRNKIKQKANEYYRNPENKPKIYKARKKYYHKILKHNINYKLTYACRSRIKSALFNNKKSNRTINLIGCSIEFFKQYLESQFEPGMTWENYGIGSGKWAIDHILCCRLFNLKSPKEQEICFHYTNLKPKWYVLNSSKSDFLDDGRRARNLTELERLQYLKSKGFDLFCLYSDFNISK